MIEYTSLKTAGTFGRPPDLAPAIAVGLLAHLPPFKAKRSMIEGCAPDFAENIEAYVRFGRENNLTASESLTGPQNDRSTAKGAEASLLRVKRVEKNGIRVSGAKTVGSIAAQANEIFFTNLGGIRDTPAEAWKASHPEIAAHLAPADVLVDKMRGKSTVFYRVRIHLVNVPAGLRPA